MNLEITDLAVLKQKLFEHLDSKSENVSLGAANLLIHLAQIPEKTFSDQLLSTMQEVRDYMREGMDMEKKKLGEENGEKDEPRE